ncbi:MAG: hypothetical protein ACRDYC_03740 [Acidimicrobiales bacterium]
MSSAHPPREQTTPDEKTPSEEAWDAGEGRGGAATDPRGGGGGGGGRRGLAG